MDQVVASSSLVTHPFLFYRKLLLLFFFILLPLWGIENFIPVIVNKIKRDPEHFTQGIKISQEYLYESGGLYGKSRLNRYLINVDQPAASPKDSYSLDSNFFAEDIEIVGEKVYLLTWKEETLFIFNRELQIIDEKKYSGEGWGLAYDGKYFITSDGSDQLTFRDPDQFSVVKTLSVKVNGQKLERINSLEMVKGKIYANVWFDSNIYIIDPHTGEVGGIIDCETLLRDNYLTSQKSENYKKFKFSEIRENVLNGITFDERGGFFYLTGKRWAYFYKVLLRKK